MNCRAVALSFFLVLPSLRLVALPVGAEVVQGEASFQSSSPNHLEITASDKAVIHWQDFSIQSKEVTRFVQPGKDAAVLNRVISGNPSAILGTLEGNGKVYLINPNGIVIGKEAVINLSGFIASTLDLLDAPYLAGGDLHFEGDSSMKVVNLGVIRAAEGDVALLAASVENSGEIAAPKGEIFLGIGKEMVIKGAGEERLIIRVGQETRVNDVGIDQSGKLEAVQIALKSKGNPYAFAIRHTGKSCAVGMEKREGRLFLVAEEGNAEVSGELIARNSDASGGQMRILGGEIAVDSRALLDVSGQQAGGVLLVGGDYYGKNSSVINARTTLVKEGAQLSIAAQQKGDAGSLFVWSKESTRFYGSVDARGGIEGGNGGLVAVLGDTYFDFHGNVNRLAPQGKAGVLLLDPSNITIVSAGTVNASTLSPFYPISSAQPSLLSVDTLKNALLEGDVIVQSAGGKGSESGDVVLATPLLYDSPYALTFRSYVPGVEIGDVRLLYPIENRGEGSLHIDSCRDVVVAGPVSTQSEDGISISGGRDLLFSAPIFTVGNLTATAGEKIEAAAPLSGEAGVSLVSQEQSVILAPIFSKRGGVIVTSSKGVEVYASLSSEGRSGVKLSADQDLVIGRSEQNSPLGVFSAIGAIAITSTHGNVVLQGGAEKGAASSISSLKSSININVTSPGKKIHFQGGEGEEAFANVESKQGSIFLWSSGDVAVESGARIALQSGGMQIRAKESFILQGGSSNKQPATVESAEGSIYVMAKRAAFIGGEGKDSAALLSNGTKPMTINVEDLIVRGTESAASLLSNSGKVNICSTNNLELQGGFGVEAAAQIKTVSGEIILESIGNDLLVKGGSGERAVAEIQAGLSHSESSSAALLLHSLGRDLIVCGGEGNDAYAGIGGAFVKLDAGKVVTVEKGSLWAHSNLSLSAEKVVVSGNGGLKSEAGSLFLSANEAQLGAVQMEGAVTCSAPAGDVTLDVQNSLRMQGGAAAQSYAEIQAGKNIILRSQGEVELLGGQGVDANSQIATAFGSIDITVAKGVSLTGGENSVAALYNYGVGGGDITVITNGDLRLGNNSLVENLGRGELNLFADQVVSMEKNAKLSHFGQGVLAVAAGQDLLFREQSQIVQSGSGQLILVSGRDTLLYDQFSAHTTTGDLTLVVDHFLPGHPVIGDGRFVMAPEVALTTAGGVLEVYTAKRGQNQVEGKLNGNPFIPGEEYIESDQERWGIFFEQELRGALNYFWSYEADNRPLQFSFAAIMSDSSAPPFVLYYKDHVRDYPVYTHSYAWKEATSITNRSSRVSSEALQDFRTYTEFLYDPLTFSVQYRGIEPGVSDFSLMLDRYEKMLRRKYRNYHDKGLSQNKENTAEGDAR